MHCKRAMMSGSWLPSFNTARMVRGNSCIAMQQYDGLQVQSRGHLIFVLYKSYLCPLSFSDASQPLLFAVNKHVSGFVFESHKRRRLYFPSIEPNHRHLPCRGHGHNRNRHCGCNTRELSTMCSKYLPCSLSLRSLIQTDRGTSPYSKIAMPHYTFAPQMTHSVHVVSKIGATTPLVRL